MRIFLTNGHRNTGLWITRHLGAAGHRLITGDSRALAFGLRSRYVERFELLPEANAPGYADELLAAIRRSRPDALIPLGGLAAISSRLEEFDRETAVLAPDGHAFRALIDKAQVYQLCGECGIPRPRVLGSDSASVGRNLPVARDGLPLAVIKPRQDYGAGRGLVFLREGMDLERVWHKLARQYGALIATEFIPGAVDTQYAVQLLFDHETELTEFFVLQKLRQWPADSGITVEARSSQAIDLVAQMLPLFKRLKWRGPVEIELKRHRDTGETCVLEINPRFAGTIAFSLAAGVDFPGGMLESSLGQSVPRTLQPYYPADLYYWNPLPYARSVLSDLSRGRIAEGLKGVVMPLSRRPTGNPYVLTDPSALLGKLLWQIGNALRSRTTNPEPPV